MTASSAKKSRGRKKRPRKKKAPKKETEEEKKDRELNEKLGLVVLKLKTDEDKEGIQKYVAKNIKNLQRTYESSQRRKKVQERKEKKKKEKASFENESARKNSQLVSRRRKSTLLHSDIVSVASANVMKHIPKGSFPAVAKFVRPVLQDTNLYNIIQFGGHRFQCDADMVTVTKAVKQKGKAVKEENALKLVELKGDKLKEALEEFLLKKEDFAEEWYNYVEENKENAEARFFRVNSGCHKTKLFNTPELWAETGLEEDKRPREWPFYEISHTALDGSGDTLSADDLDEIARYDNYLHDDAAIHKSSWCRMVDLEKVMQMDKFQNLIHPNGKEYSEAERNAAMHEYLHSFDSSFTYNMFKTFTTTRMVMQSPSICQYTNKFLYRRKWPRRQSTPAKFLWDFFFKAYAKWGTKLDVILKVSHFENTAIKTFMVVYPILFTKILSPYFFGEGGEHDHKEYSKPTKRFTSQSLRHFVMLNSLKCVLLNHMEELKAQITDAKQKASMEQLISDLTSTDQHDKALVSCLASDKEYSSTRSSVDIVNTFELNWKDKLLKKVKKKGSDHFVWTIPSPKIKKVAGRPTFEVQNLDVPTDRRNHYITKLMEGIATVGGFLETDHDDVWYDYVVMEPCGLLNLEQIDQLLTYMDWHLGQSSVGIMCLLASQMKLFLEHFIKKSSKDLTLLGTRHVVFKNPGPAATTTLVQPNSVTVLFFGRHGKAPGRIETAADFTEVTAQEPKRCSDTIIVSRPSQPFNLAMTFKALKEKVEDLSWLNYPMFSYGVWLWLLNQFSPKAATSTEKCVSVLNIHPTWRMPFFAALKQKDLEMAVMEIRDDPKLPTSTPISIMGMAGDIFTMFDVSELDDILDVLKVEYYTRNLHEADRPICKGRKIDQFAVHSGDEEQAYTSRSRSPSSASKSRSRSRSRSRYERPIRSKYRSPSRSRSPPRHRRRIKSRSPSRSRQTYRSYRGRSQRSYRRSRSRSRFQSRSRSRSRSSRSDRHQSSSKRSSSSSYSSQASPTRSSTQKRKRSSPEQSPETTKHKKQKLAKTQQY